MNLNFQQAAPVRSSSDQSSQLTQQTNNNNQKDAAGYSITNSSKRRRELSGNSSNTAAQRLLKNQNKQIFNQDQNVMVPPSSQSNARHAVNQAMGNQQSSNNESQNSNIFSQGAQQQQPNRASLVSQGSNMAGKQGNTAGMKHQKSMSMHQQMSTTGYNSSQIKNSGLMSNQQLGNMLAQGNATVNHSIEQNYGNGELSQSQTSKPQLNRQSLNNQGLENMVSAAAARQKQLDVDKIATLNQNSLNGAYM